MDDRNESKAGEYVTFPDYSLGLGRKMIDTALPRMEPYSYEDGEQQRTPILSEEI
jgi:hypothetical protein